jgi:predicted DNA-binding transcriptional regulator AlpA
VELHDTTANNDSTLLLSAEKLAELLDISVRTLWRLRAAGKLPAPIRIGGSVRWRAQEIAIWVERGCPVQPKSKAASHGQALALRQPLV